MKRSITSIIALALALVLVAALPLTASATETADYEKVFDFLDATTYESSLVYNKDMKTAGNSTKMGYKGWIASTNIEGASSVFVFEAAEGKTFESLVLNYRGYSIAEGAPDGVHIYVSTVGETDYNAGYTDANWTLVAEIVNDMTAGNGVNVEDPANRDTELLRSVDVSASALGCSKVYMRIDFYRSSNIDGVPATYFAPAGATGTYMSEAPVVTEPTTEAHATEPATEPTPEATETEPTSPSTGDATLMVILVAAIAIIGTAACVVTKRRVND